MPDISSESEAVLAVRRDEMITDWYIEGRDGETWRDVSNQFLDWLQNNSSLQTFGFSEGDSVKHAGKSLYNFRFPARLGDNILLFEVWAKSTGRLFGGSKDGVLHLNDSQRLTLPSKVDSPMPPWLH